MFRRQANICGQGGLAIGLLILSLSWPAELALAGEPAKKAEVPAGAPKAGKKSDAKPAEAPPEAAKPAEAKANEVKPSGGEGAGGETSEQVVRVLPGQVTVRLSDGSSVAGTVLMSGLRGLSLVTAEEKEIFIERSRIVGVDLVEGQEVAPEGGLALAKTLQVVIDKGNLVAAPLTEGVVVAEPEVEPAADPDAPEAEAAPAAAKPAKEKKAPKAKADRPNREKGEAKPKAEAANPELPAFGIFGHEAAAAKSSTAKTGSSEKKAEKGKLASLLDQLKKSGLLPGAATK